MHNIQSAINVIESVSGFTEEDTPVGESWQVILEYIKTLENNNDFLQHAINEIYRITGVMKKEPEKIEGVQTGLNVSKFMNLHDLMLRGKISYDDYVSEVKECYGN